jgi:hypothetical protein
VLRPAGQPLHTRSLTLAAAATGDGRLHVRGDVIDLRKRGMMPVPGGLQAAGLIHHMHLDATFDPERRVLEKLTTGQPSVAFEPSEESRGECCRDPAPRLQALVGECVDDGWSRRLAAAFGGPRGCSHLLTLAQLLGSAAPRVLDWESEQGRLTRRARGERVFSRMLSIDGLEPDEGHMALHLQLTDVHSEPARDAAGYMDRFGRQSETQVLAHVDGATLGITALDAVERERTLEGFGPGGWRDLGERVGVLVGHSIMGGLARRVLEHFGDDADHVLLRDCLLNLAPGYIQCMAAALDRVLEQAVEARRRADSGGVAPASERGKNVSDSAIGGTPDSCYMWRSDGALAKYRFGS